MMYKSLLLFYLLTLNTQSQLVQHWFLRLPLEKVFRQRGLLNILPNK